MLIVKIKQIDFVFKFLLCFLSTVCVAAGVVMHVYVVRSTWLIMKFGIEKFLMF